MLLAATAFASVKVGIIDLPQILQNSPQVKAINTKLKNEFKPQQEKIASAQANIRSEAEKLAPNKAESLKPEQKKAIQDKIMAKQKELQQMVVSFQQKVGDAQENAMKSFMKKIDDAVESVAKKDDLDLVLLKPAVVYASNTVDVTQAVMKALK